MILVLRFRTLKENPILFPLRVWGEKSVWLYYDEWKKESETPNKSDLLIDLVYTFM